MPICPACKTNQKSRKNGMCPNCLEDIIIYKGNWIRASIGSPTSHILERFESAVSKKLSTPTRKVVWQIPRRSMTYTKELSIAEKIIEQGNGDMEYVDRVLDEVFTSDRFAWKNRESLASVLRDFSMAQAIMDAKEQEETDRRQKERDAYDAVMKRPDIFA